jgi:hypothetical protein
MSGARPLPEVSVIIPTRDRPTWLSLSLRSALSQRHVELEVIVIDDASSQVVRPSIDAIADRRVRLIRTPDALGESGARNQGIQASRGRWLAFLDDDDLWSPDKLALQREALRETGRGWAYGGYVTVDDDLDLLSGSPPPTPESVVSELSRYNAVPGSSSSVIVAAELAREVGPFDPTLRRTPDWDMWLRLARVGPPAAVDRPIVALSVHPGNASRDMEALFRELPILAARHGIRVDIARHHRWAAWMSSLDGRRAAAIRHYARAVAAGDIASVARAISMLVPGPYRGVRTNRPVGPWVGEARVWLAPFKRCPDPAAVR